MGACAGRAHTILQEASKPCLGACQSTAATRRPTHLGQAVDASLSRFICCHRRCCRRRCCRRLFVAPRAEAPGGDPPLRVCLPPADADVAHGGLGGAQGSACPGQLLLLLLPAAAAADGGACEINLPQLLLHLVDGGRQRLQQAAGRRDSRVGSGSGHDSSGQSPAPSTPLLWRKGAASLQHTHAILLCTTLCMSCCSCCSCCSCRRCRCHLLAAGSRLPVV